MNSSNLRIFLTFFMKKRPKDWYRNLKSISEVGGEEMCEKIYFK